MWYAYKRWYQNYDDERENRRLMEQETKFEKRIENFRRLNSSSPKIRPA